MKFKDACNYTMLVVGLISIGAQVYENHKKNLKDLAMSEADDWMRDTKARLQAMRSHGVQNRVTKLVMAEAYGAAKNVILDEVAGSDNRFMRINARKLAEQIDLEIATL